MDTAPGQETAADIGLADGGGAQTLTGSATRSPRCSANPGTDQRLTWAVFRVRLGIFVMKVRTVETSAMMPMVV